MIIICDYPCDNRREAEQEEDRYMQILKPNLNMRRAYQTPETRKEYIDNRKDIKKEYDKARRTEKAEEIKSKNVRHILEIKISIGNETKKHT
jgi:hypothetical protein